MFFTFNSKRKDFELSFDVDRWIESLLIVSIFSDKKDPALRTGGWWAEELEEMKLGSELYKLKRSKLTHENVELAVQSVSNALSNLHEAHILSDFQISPEIKPGALLLNIGVTKLEKQTRIDYVFHLNTA